MTAPELVPVMTLGDLSTIVTIILAIAGAYYGLKGQLEVFRSELSAHADTLTAHGLKMEHHDEEIKEVFGDVKQIMGRMEISNERRAHSRGGG